jgi:two-component system OmpR family response regulator
MMSAVAGPRVLVVEDDDGIRSLLVAALGREALDVDAAADGAEALELCRMWEYAVIVLDLMMPRVNGFDFLEAFNSIPPRANPVIFVVTAFDDRVIGQVASSQVHAIVRKPFDVEQFVATIHAAAQTWREHAVVAPAPADAARMAEAVAVDVIMPPPERLE